MNPVLSCPVLFLSGSGQDVIGVVLISSKGRRVWSKELNTLWRRGFPGARGCSRLTEVVV